MHIYIHTVIDFEEGCRKMKKEKELYVLYPKKILHDLVPKQNDLLFLYELKVCKVVLNHFQ